MGRFQRMFEHLDADTPGFSVFIDRALNFVMAEVFNTQIPPLKGALFVPRRATAPAGAKSITYKQYTRAGIAQFITSFGADLPNASVWVKEFTTKIYPLGISYRYTLEDLLAAMMSNANAMGGAPLNLDLELATAALVGQEKKLDNVARVGSADGLSPSLGLVGLLNIAAAIIYTVPNGASSGTQAWAGKTPDEIANDCFGIAAAQVAATFEVESPDSLIVPLAQHGIIAQKRMGDGSNVTIKQFVKENSPWIKNIDPWQFLSGAGAGSTDRMVCYNKSPRKLWQEVPFAFRQEAPQLRNLEVIVPCWGKTAGVIVPYPLSVSYGDGI